MTNFFYDFFNSEINLLLGRFVVILYVKKYTSVGIRSVSTIEHYYPNFIHIMCTVHFSTLTRYNRQFSNIIEYEVKTPTSLKLCVCACVFFIFFCSTVRKCCQIAMLLSLTSTQYKYNNLMCYGAPDYWLRISSVC